MFSTEDVFITFPKPMAAVDLTKWPQEYTREGAVLKGVSFSFIKQRILKLIPPQKMCRVFFFLKMLSTAKKLTGFYCFIACVFSFKLYAYLKLVINKRVLIY